MRNPGYINNEMAWSYGCEVLFNGYDFGPNLAYSELKFLPAELRTNEQKIPGMPGAYRYSHIPAGYPVPDPITGTLKLFVKDARAWGFPSGDVVEGLFISPEAYFLSIVNSGTVRLDFKNTNLFWLNADLKLTEYSRFNLGFNITLKFKADPYWWETGLKSVEWSLGAQGSVNLFNPNTATINTELLPVGQSCVWESAAGGRGWYLLHADPGRYAEIHIGNLTAANRYRVGCRNIYSHGLWQLYTAGGQRILSDPFTGVTEVVLRLISKANSALAVGFTDICLYEVGAGSATGEIETLDAPLRTMICTASAPCRIIFGGEVLSLPVGEDVTVRGLNIPPRTKLPVQVVSDVACFGYITYQRGALSCTL